MGYFPHSKDTELETQPPDNSDRQPLIPLSWENRIAAFCHVAPALWFVPFSILLPIVIVLYVNKHSIEIARNAREATLFWGMAYIALAIAAVFFGAGWIYNILWFATTLWGVLAAWSAWAGIERPYPELLTRAVLLWENAEPRARDWLGQKARATVNSLQEATKSPGQQADVKTSSELIPESSNIAAPMATREPVPAPALSVSGQSAAMTNSVKYALFGSVLGSILGIPLSYWFQPGMMRQFISWPMYLSELLKALGHIDEISRGSDVFGIFQVIMFTVVITGIAGAIAGFALGTQKAARSNA